MQGLFNEIFDLNHDGKLNDVERTVELGAFATIIDLDDKEDKKKEMEMSELDEEEIDVMDERREALEEAGIDPDEYEF